MGFRKSSVKSSRNISEETDRIDKDYCIALVQAENDGPWTMDMTVGTETFLRCVWKRQSMEINNGFNLGVREKEMPLMTSGCWHNKFGGSCFIFGNQIY